jgi:hypothetical protein
VSGALFSSMWAMVPGLLHRRMQLGFSLVGHGGCRGGDLCPGVSRVEEQFVGALLWWLTAASSAVPSKLKGVGHRSLCFACAELVSLPLPHSKWRVPRWWCGGCARRPHRNPGGVKGPDRIFGLDLGSFLHFHRF